MFLIYLFFLVNLIHDYNGSLEQIKPNVSQLKIEPISHITTLCQLTPYTKIKTSTAEQLYRTKEIGKGKKLKYKTKFLWTNKICGVKKLSKAQYFKSELCEGRKERYIYEGKCTQFQLLLEKDFAKVEKNNNANGRNTG